MCHEKHKFHWPFKVLTEDFDKRTSKHGWGDGIQQQQQKKIENKKLI